MNCVVFTKMNQVFSLKKQQNIKNTRKMENNTGKFRELCQSGKVVTMLLMSQSVANPETRKRIQAVIFVAIYGRS